MPFMSRDLLIDALSARESAVAGKKPKPKTKPAKTICQIRRTKKVCGVCTRCNTRTKPPSRCTNPTSTQVDECGNGSRLNEALEQLTRELRERFKVA
jgi:hypothetical protein